MAPDAITVDLSGMTIGDLAMFDAMSKKELSMSEMVTFLDRLVVGGARHLPLARLREVMAAVQVAVVELGNPTDGQGKA